MQIHSWFKSKYYVGFCCRSPRGERGLKSRLERLYLTTPQVALLAESVDWNCQIGSITSKRLCRSPRGERGLKLHCVLERNVEERSLSSRRAWIEIIVVNVLEAVLQVALLAESVDWNLIMFYVYLIPVYVALLAESVDWNDGCRSSKSKCLYCRSSRGERGLK